MTASDIVQKVAQRAGLQCKVDATTTPLDHTTPGRRQRLGLPAPPGRRARPGAHPDATASSEFTRAGRRRARLRAAARGRGTTRSSSSGASTWCTCAARSPRGGQVAGGRGARLGPGTEEGARRHAERQDRERRARQRRHARLGGRDVRAAVPYVVGLATLEQPGRRGRHRRLPLRPPGGRLRRAGGYGARQPRAPRRDGREAGRRRRAVLGQVRAHVAPGTSSRRTTATGRASAPATTSERSLYGMAERGAPEPAADQRRGPRDRHSVKDPDQLGRVKIKLPWLADSYESWWARTVQPGAGKDRGRRLAARGRGRGAGGVRPGRPRAPLRRSAASTTAWTSRTGGWADERRRRRPGQSSGAAWCRGPGWCSSSSRRAGAESSCVSTNGGAQKVVLTQTAAKGIEIISEGPVKVHGQAGTSTSSTASGNVDPQGR